MNFTFLLIGIGTIGLIWFLLPFFTKKILNIGNVTGIITSILMILSAFGIMIVDSNSRLNSSPLLNSISFGLSDICCSNIIMILFLIIAIVIAVVMIISVCMYVAANKKPASNSTVVVLGCRVYGTKASLMLEERLYAALKYLNENPSSKVIVSGGQGHDEGISEAECMYNWLIDKGLEPSRIILENKSTTTYENILYSFEIIENRKLNPQIALVSNEFHLYRGMKLAEICINSIEQNKNITCGAIKAKTAWWLFPTFYVRELYAIMALWLRLKK
ncbi:MAG: YdcF family protein [Lachnospiraceae bacterium]|nr:YdcF family protein [Lachnospiraceae bacterium]